ncbi:MAG: translocation/assembly module TamB domain-containing protein, partial [Pseudomonadota bacterium]|nr:translocation/assembly module TamB domain-containing protein [Pseudomonadota bacterium]
AEADFAQQPSQPILWQATLDTQGLNPQKIVASLPMDELRGRLAISGQSTPAQQTITLQNIDMSARLPQAEQASREVALQGAGQAVLLMHQAQGQSGLRSFATRFNGQLNTAGVPEGSLVFKASGTPKLIKIEQLAHDGVAGQLGLNGQVDLTNGLAWQLVAQMQNLDTGFFAPDWAGQLTGRVDSQGRWQPQVKEIQLRELSLNGTLRQQPINASGRLDLAFNPTPKTAQDLVPQRFQAEQLNLAWAGNRIVANGNTQNLVLQVNAPQLGLIHPDLAGKVTGQLNVSGQQQAPDILVNLKVDDLRFAESRLAQARLTGKLQQLAQQPSQLTLSLSQLTHGERALESAELRFAGTQAAHVLDARVQSPVASAVLQLAGGLRADQQWLGLLQKGQIDSAKMKLRQDRPAALSVNAQTQQIQLDPHCWANNGSRLCLVEPLQASQTNAQAALRLQNLEIDTFRDVMPEGMVWQGKLNGQAKASWQKGQSPSLDAQIYTDHGSIGLSADDPQDPPLTLAYQRLSLIARTQPEGIRIRFDAKTPSIGTGYVDAIIDPEPKTINGALVLDEVQLSVFKPFFPAMRTLSGIASLAGGMSGPITGPEFYGNFKLRDGRVQLAAAPVNLTRINLESSIRGTQASLTGDFYSGDGRGELEGQAVWANTPQIDLKLTGQNLAIRQAPMLNARVSPAIDIRVLPKRRQVTVNGRIDIPRAVISPATTGEHVVAVSSDVRVV